MKFTISTSKFGAILSLAIILARALSQNSLPMEMWSVTSWFLMLLPMYFPWVIFCIVYVFMGIALCLCGIVIFIRCLWKRFFG